MIDFINADGKRPNKMSKKIEILVDRQAGWW